MNAPICISSNGTPARDRCNRPRTAIYFCQASYPRVHKDNSNRKGQGESALLTVPNILYLVFNFCVVNMETFPQGANYCVFNHPVGEYGLSKCL